MSGQHCENYDVKRETVHFYPRNVDRCGTSFVNKVIICFPPVWPTWFVIKKKKNHLMTGPLGTVNFVSFESGNKIPCSPRDQSLSAKCLLLIYHSDWKRCSKIVFLSTTEIHEGRFFHMQQNLLEGNTIKWVVLSQLRLQPPFDTLINIWKKGSLCDSQLSLWSGF